MLIASVEVKEYNSEISGRFGILKLSEVIYVVDYKSPSNQISCDLDDLSFIDESLQAAIESSILSCSAKFVFLNSDDYHHIKRIVEKCNHICDLTLHLNAVVRDYYFSGIRSKIGEKKNLCLSNEVMKLFTHFSSTSITSNMFSFEPEEEKVLRFKTGKRPRYFLDNKNDILQCFYCGQKDTKSSYALHPYVPRTSSSAAVLFCWPCLESWYDHRELADSHGDLILMDQCNEELCSVCSVSPPEIVLCDTCTRSYCHTCVAKLLTSEEYQKEVINGGDKLWRCICCVLGLEAHPNLNRESWLKVAHSLTASNSNTIEILQSPSIQETSVSSERPKIKRICRPIISKPQIADEYARPYRQRHPVTGILKMENQEVRDNEQTTNNYVDSITKESVNLNPVPLFVSDRDDELGIIFEKINPPTNTTTNTITIAPSFPFPKKNYIPSSLFGHGHSSSSSSSYIDRKLIMSNITKTLHDNNNNSSNNNNDDELFYFNQYVKYFEQLHKNGPRGVGGRHETDDSCFLCKDGGQLVECDWKARRNGTRLRCLKVYHETCLNYVPQDDQLWYCPRHFCLACGERKIRYMCKYCANSICATCPPVVVERHGLARYCRVEVPKTFEYPSDVQAIICQTCLDLIHRCISRGSLSSEYLPSGTILKFPGFFDPNQAQPTYVTSNKVSAIASSNVISQAMNNNGVPNSKASDEIVTVGIPNSKASDEIVTVGVPITQLESHQVNWNPELNKNVKIELLPTSSSSHLTSTSQQNISLDSRRKVYRHSDSRSSTVTVSASDLSKENNAETSKSVEETSSADPVRTSALLSLRALLGSTD